MLRLYLRLDADIVDLLKGVHQFITDLHQQAEGHICLLQAGQDLGRLDILTAQKLLDLGTGSLLELIDATYPLLDQIQKGDRRLTVCRPTLVVVSRLGESFRTSSKK
jgi:hypothetical protein